MRCFRCIHASEIRDNPVWAYCWVKEKFVDARGTCDRFLPMEEDGEC